MKNFNNLCVLLQTQLLGAGVHEKSNIEGALPKKGGLDSLQI